MKEPKSPEQAALDLLAFAESVGAKVVLPTPGFSRNLYDKTDVRKTWEKFFTGDFDTPNPYARQK